MAWRGSFSRSLLSTAALRSSAPRSAPRLLRPPVAPSGLNPRRFSLSNPRTLGELGCTQSLMPLVSMAPPGVRLTSHLSVNLRACCDLFNGN